MADYLRGLLSQPEQPSVWGALRDPQFRADMRQGLTDTFNRGVIGGLLGAPVDIATTLMRPFGYDVEKPVGGSEWIGDKMQLSGLVSKNRNPLAEALSSFVDPGTMAAAPLKLSALLKGTGGAGLAGMTVFHGSPYKFDKFDMSKIGTGEGAQAYGHGLYFAETPDVAKGYASLGHVKGNISTIGGKDINSVYSSLENQAARLPVQQAAGHYEKMGMLESLMNNQTPSEVAKFAQDNGYSKATIDWFKTQVIPKYQGSGNLYKVDLPDEHIAKMLDWDKPLSQQPEFVRKALANGGIDATEQGVKNAAANKEAAFSKMREIERNLGDKHPDYMRAFNNFTESRKKLELAKIAATEPASSFYSNLGKSAEDASAYLRSLGIPGIRYLDGGSRSGGKGTSNFVVFDDQLPKIIGRE